MITDQAINAGAIIIAISAYSNTEYLLNIIEIGISHYALKQIDFDKLFASMDKCLTRRAQLQSTTLPRRLSPFVTGAHA